MSHDFYAIPIIPSGISEKVITGLNKYVTWPKDTCVQNIPSEQFTTTAHIATYNFRGVLWWSSHLSG